MSSDPLASSLPDAPATLRLVASAGPEEESNATDFLRASGLTLSSVLLGLLDQSDDCIKLIDSDGRLNFMNCNGKKAMQIDEFCDFAGRSWESLWPEEARPLLLQAMDVARSGKISRFEAACPTAKGEDRWWEVTVSPVRSEAGAVEAFLATSRDISDRRRRDESLAIVAAEMRHRLRNAHAIGASLLIASGHSEPVYRDFSHAVAARLARLADVQAKMLDVENGLALSTMCADVSQMFEASGGTLNCCDLPDVMLDEERARAISLLLGELTTNSLKHGALGRGGDVELSGAMDGDTLLLEWVEHDVGKETPHIPASSGQGQILMARILRLYRGSIDAGMTDSGYRAEIRLPIR